MWGYSRRTQGLGAGSCESGAADCSPMAGWGLQTIVDDVAFVRRQTPLAHPGERPVVGGLSLGSIASAAVINAAPQDYAGATLIEGTIYDEDPAVRAVNAGFCAGMLDTAALLSNARVTMNYEEDYGHVDHVFSANHLREVEHPVLKWLKGIN